jgi:hypothetical protein
MGLFDSILSAVVGETDSSGRANPLIRILGGLPYEGRVRRIILTGRQDFFKSRRRYTDPRSV